MNTIRCILIAAMAAIAAAAEDDSARRKLYASPKAELPDVYLSKSVIFGTEGDSVTYTVVLTHQPGMKEDETVDTAKDEVYVYLTSSQDVYQEYAPGIFNKENSHRSQLSIATTEWVTAGTHNEGTDVKKGATATSWIDSPSCVASTIAACKPSAGGKNLPWGCGDKVPSATIGTGASKISTTGAKDVDDAALADWTCPWGFQPAGYGDAAVVSDANPHETGNSQSGTKDCGKGCDPTSSPTYLTFDSTNWATPQTVTVTLRDDKVFEPEVNNRGQDAYVHHYVVAQDVATSHSYYHNHKVNDVTISITDNDPAVVLEDDAQADGLDGTGTNVIKNNPIAIEGGANAALKLKLSSEPMYDVRVDLQSGAYFKTCDDNHENCVAIDAASIAGYLPPKPYTSSWNGADDNHVLFSSKTAAIDQTAHDYYADSHVTFTTQNWDTWQTMQVLARNDHEDEGANRNHQIGFIITSLDYYYNSEGAGALPGSSYVAKGAAGYTTADAKHKMPPLAQRTTDACDKTVGGTAYKCVKANQKVCTEADPNQVYKFDTSKYDTRLGKDSRGNSKCGGYVTNIDNNVRGITISKTYCEATENVQAYKMDQAGTATASTVTSDAKGKRTSSATCDYTIKLDAAPIEGTTVVVHLREDQTKTEEWDHELWMIERKTSRTTVGGVYAAATVPQPTSAFTVKSSATASAAAAADGESYDLDIYFTDEDGTTCGAAGGKCTGLAWNTARSIQLIADNDEEDEEEEQRTVFHTSSGTDPNYSCATTAKCAAMGKPTASIVVNIVDDDIADLVLLCNDNSAGVVAVAGPAGSDYTTGAGVGSVDSTSRVGPTLDGDDTAKAAYVSSTYATATVKDSKSHPWIKRSGVKGTGPANDEAMTGSKHACTIYSRECMGGKDSEGNACVQGKYNVRLNASPGTKTTRTTFLGETTSSLIEAPVFVVITPDPTPQTRFEPTSVTFQQRLGCADQTGKGTTGKTGTSACAGVSNGDACKTGAARDACIAAGTLTAGAYSWDDEVTITVIPVDDKIDERHAEIVDYTAHTVTQSHGVQDDSTAANYVYWSHNVPFQVKTDTVTSSYTHASTCGKPGTDGAGDLEVDTCGGIVVTDHTKYRHTIKTVHRHDNDFAGVTVESGMAQAGAAAGAFGKTAQLQTADSANNNKHSHTNIKLGATEGETFAYYTLKLDTQPRKAQRQTGANPNTDIEREETYWVDVTAQENIQIDLAVPASCPTEAVWGGGAKASTITTSEANAALVNDIKIGYTAPGGTATTAKQVVNRYNYPPDDPNTPGYEAQTGYYATCGGWQRDATYRFTSSKQGTNGGSWDIPQYVYVYAHNDKDGVQAAGAGSGGAKYTNANKGMTDINDADVTIVHTVETEDSPANMRRGCTTAPCNTALGATGSKVYETGFVSTGMTYRWDQRKSCGAFAACTANSGTAKYEMPGTVEGGAMGAGATDCCAAAATNAECKATAALGNPCMANHIGTVDEITVGGATGWSLSAGATATKVKSNMANPPKDVVVTIKDNDNIATQSASAISACRQTMLFNYPQATGTEDSSEWLVDYNCNNGDAGGLPGFPGARNVAAASGSPT